MWRTTPVDPAARTARSAARTVIIVATVVFTLLVCRLRPWDLFADAGFSNDFYDEQARSFLRLRLSVRPEVPGIEGFLVDGRTYLYFGPFLALVRLPFAVFGDLFAGRLTRLSMIIGYVVLCTASYHLVEVARQWARSSRQQNAETAIHHSTWRTAGFVAAVACSPALFLTGWVSVYHETELWAAAFAAWSMVAVLRFGLDPSRRHALVAAGSIAAAILTRAPVGIGMAVGGGLVALAMWRAARTNASIVIGGCVVGFVAHVALNLARFGSLLDLPAERQVLSINDPVRAAWFAGNDGSFFSIRFLPTTVVHYLRPDTVRFERLMPFIRFGPLATDRGSYPMETITPAASLTTSATVLFCGALVGVVVLVARRAWIPLALVAGGAIAAIPTFTIGFIGNRYLVDMLPLLMLPAAFAFASWRVAPAAARRLVRIAIGALVVWGAWCNISLAAWTQNLKEPGFTEWRYRIDDALFAEPAPSLIVHDPSAPVARDGVVAISLGGDGASCNGVYIAEQGAWVPLERANRARRLEGTIVPVDAADVPVAGGDTWTISVRADGATLLVVADIDGEPVEGEPVAWSGRAVEVSVLADEIARELAVTVDGRLGLFSFAVPDGPMLAFESFELDESPGDSLCRRLQARL